MVTAKGLFVVGILATFVYQIAAPPPESPGIGEGEKGNPWYRQCEDWYDTLSTQISGLPAAIGALINSGEGAILDLINNRMDALNGRIDALQAEHVTLTQLINTRADAIDATLQQILSGQSAITADLQTKFTALESEVQAGVSQLSNEHNNLESVVMGESSTLSSEISFLSSELANLASTIDGYYLDHQAALSDHEALVDGRQDQLEALVDTRADEVLALFNTKFQGLIDTCSVVPTSTSGAYQDCTEVLNNGYTESGVYTIYPTGFPKGVNVLCDMETDGGGWTIFQQRSSGDVDFYRTFVEFEDGFGLVTPAGDFWLGNKYIHAISQQGSYELRVDLTGDAASSNEQRAAIYQGFSLGDAASFYTLTVGAFSFDSTLGSSPGDSLTYHSGKKFTTKDVDNDDYGSNCAVTYKGGWWYSSCHKSNLNGEWGNTNYGEGPLWQTFLGYNRPMSYTRMMIRNTA